MPDAPTRFERIANWFDGLRKVLVALGVGAIVVVVLVAVVRETALGGIAIDPVVVKATDTPDAPTSELAAQQIARQLDRIQRSGVQEWQRLHVDDGIHPVDLQIPGAPLSVRGAAREVVALFGLAPATLRSALTRRNDQGRYSAVMSLAGDHGSMANCPADGVDDTLDNIYECIAFNAIAFVDPKTAAAYILKREQAECKGLDTGLAQGMPDLHREEHRINNRRERCSFARTQKLIAKMMGSANKSDLRWVSYIYGQIHMARAVALADVGLQQQLSELDQAIGRFNDSQRQMKDSPTAIAVLMRAFLTKGIIIHQTTSAMQWVDDPDSLLQKRLDIADKTFAEAAAQLQQLPAVRSANLDALVSRLQGLLIYRQWMIDAHRRTKSGIVTVATGQKAELEDLGRAAARYAAAEAKLPASASELLEWGNILRAAGKFEDAIAKYRRAVDLDPSNADAALNIVISYVERVERNAGPPDTGQVLVALGSLADYLAWLSSGGPYRSLLHKVKRLLASVGHGEAFEECLSKTLTAPPSADPGIEKWKDAAVFKFCVDGAIDSIARVGLRTGDVANASR